MRRPHSSARGGARADENDADRGRDCAAVRRTRQVERDAGPRTARRAAVPAAHAEAHRAARGQQAGRDRGESGAKAAGRPDIAESHRAARTACAKAQVIRERRKQVTTAPQPPRPRRRSAEGVSASSLRDRARPRRPETSRRMRRWPRPNRHEAREPADMPSARRRRRRKCRAHRVGEGCAASRIRRPQARARAADEGASPRRRNSRRSSASADRRPPGAPGWSHCRRLPSSKRGCDRPATDDSRGSRRCAHPPITALSLLKSGP